MPRRPALLPSVAIEVSIGALAALAAAVKAGRRSAHSSAALALCPTTGQHLEPRPDAE